jgi:HPt (histidine-containing phosphotransfer) domain-containing protein
VTLKFFRSAPFSSESPMFRRLLQVLDVDRLIPAAIRAGDSETLRKARIAIYFSAALLVQCAIYIPTYIIEGIPECAYFIAIGATGLVFLPLSLRAERRPLAWAGLQIGGLTLGVLTATACYTGGLHSTSLWWMAMVPVLTMLIAGKRLALLMAALHVAIVLAFYQAQKTGVVFPMGPDPREQPHVILNDVSFLMITLVMLAWLFERAKERTLQAVAEHVAELRLILDSVGQGFLCCDASGTIVGRHSSIVVRWFGALAPGQKLWSYVGASDASFAALFEMGWMAIADDLMPIELCIDQVPLRFTHGDRSFKLELQPVNWGQPGAVMVVVVTDITAILASERAESAQRELAVALDHAVRDRAGFLQFVDEVDALVAGLHLDSPSLRRVLHTIKGNCGFFGVQSVADASHAAEGRLEDGLLEPAELAELAARWGSFCSSVSLVLDRRERGIEIDAAHYAALRGAVREGASHATLDRMVAELRYEPVSIALGRAAEQARALAERLGKGEIEVAIEATDLRLDPDRWRALWSASVHAIRNAVDHGLEAPEEREHGGKPGAGRLGLSARIDGERLVIAIEDDGRGVDWDAVAERARAAGLPHGSRAELCEALFADGLSTRDTATDVSGRGIGMTALRHAVRDLGGRLELTSERGAGTRLCLSFPAEARWSRPPAPAHVTARDAA